MVAVAVVLVAVTVTAVLVNPARVLIIVFNTTHHQPPHLLPTPRLETQQARALHQDISDSDSEGRETLEQSRAGASRQVC
mmetsp:Transcript_40118/g.82167  ORF Transcript_40118/g.82167 Transcript_40118/m.82167 type:complete len:80 (+) Transcript_40118:11-250(+)